MKEKTVTICCSASFYKQALDVSEKLQKRGLRVLIPHTAYRMEKENNFDVSAYKTWFTNDNDWHKKSALMNQHFEKVLQSEAVLVLNYEKNGLSGYIGGNVLMEMALAFHYKKPIYVLHKMTVTHTGSGTSATEREISKVYFDVIPEQKIEEFLKQGIAHRYAGGFTPQSPLIAPYLRIDGTFESVLGLPLNTLETLLQKVGS